MRRRPRYHRFRNSGFWQTRQPSWRQILRILSGAARHCTAITASPRWNVLWMEIRKIPGPRHSIRLILTWIWKGNTGFQKSRFLCHRMDTPSILFITVQTGRIIQSLQRRQIRHPVRQKVSRMMRKKFRPAVYVFSWNIILPVKKQCSMRSGFSGKRQVRLRRQSLRHLFPMRLPGTTGK